MTVLDTPNYAIDSERGRHTVMKSYSITDEDIMGFFLCYIGLYYFLFVCVNVLQSHKAQSTHHCQGKTHFSHLHEYPMPRWGSTSNILSVCPSLPPTRHSLQSMFCSRAKKTQRSQFPGDFLSSTKNRPRKNPSFFFFSNVPSIFPNILL